MLNNKKIFIYNLCFGLSKLYTNIQQDQKAKLDYYMPMLFPGGEGVGLEFYLLCVCVCVCVCVCRGVQVQYLSFREKITDLDPINK